MQNEEVEREEAVPVAYPNGLISNEYDVGSCRDTLEMLNYALAGYLSKFGNVICFHFLETQQSYFTVVNLVVNF